jgi:hypothetical protein
MRWTVQRASHIHVVAVIDRVHTMHATQHVQSLVLPSSDENCKQYTNLPKDGRQLFIFGKHIAPACPATENHVISRHAPVEARKLYAAISTVLRRINPLTPELNPSAQRCLPRFFTVDFAS